MHNNWCFFAFEQRMFKHFFVNMEFIGIDWDWSEWMDLIQNYFIQSDFCNNSLTFFSFLEVIPDFMTTIDHWEVSNIILGMLESSGFWKYSTQLLCQCLCHCHCLYSCHCLCIHVPFYFWRSFQNILWWLSGKNLNFWANSGSGTCACAFAGGSQCSGSPWSDLLCGPTTNISALDWHCKWYILSIINMYEYNCSQQIFDKYQVWIFLLH